MSHILLLISNPHIPSVDETLCARVSKQFNTKTKILAQNIAAEFDIKTTHDDIHQQAQMLIKNAPIDIVVLRDDAPRRKDLLIADMESTIIEQECLDELADMCGLGAQIADITARAMRGALDFESALRARVKALANLPETILPTLYNQRISLMPGAQALIATMRAHGAKCGLVSGGFAYFVERIATRLEFDFWASNDLEIIDGRMSGEIITPILGRAEKAAYLIKKRGAPPCATMAVGDGANDIDMLAQADIGVAFRAKPMAQDAADIAITHSDLTALLYIQGYSASDFSP